MKILEENLKTPDGKDLGFLIEFDLKYPDNIKRKTKTFHLLLKIKKLILINEMVIWKNTI